MSCKERGGRRLSQEVLLKSMHHFITKKKEEREKEAIDQVKEIVQKSSSEMAASYLITP